MSFSVNIKEPFISKWAIPSNHILNMKLNPDYTYNFIIDWGDGTPPEHIITSANITHTYGPSVTESTVTIYGELPGFARPAALDPNNRAALIQIYVDYLNTEQGMSVTFAEVKVMLDGVPTSTLYTAFSGFLSTSPFSGSLIEIVNLGAVGWKNLDNAFSSQSTLTKVSGGLSRLG